MAVPKRPIEPIACVCYSASSMTQPTISIPISTIEKMASVTRTMIGILKELHQEQRLPSEMTDDDAFWRDCEALEESFAELSEQQVQELVNNAVSGIRSQPLVSA